MRRDAPFSMWRRCGWLIGLAGCVLAAGSASALTPTVGSAALPGPPLSGPAASELDPAAQPGAFCPADVCRPRASNPLVSAAGFGLCVGLAGIAARRRRPIA